MTRAGNAPAPGKLEKEGKRALRSAIEALQDERTTYAEVEARLEDALSRLHDYVTTRKEMPTIDRFAEVVIQHFQSIMQVSPALQRIAEQLMTTWLRMVSASWGHLLTLDQAFADRVRDACSLYVQAPRGKKRKGVFEDDGTSDVTFEKDIGADAGYRLDPDDTDELPKDVFGRVRVVNTRDLSRAQVISYLNRMAQQGLIRAAALIEHLIGLEEAARNEFLDKLDVQFAILDDGRVFFKLRGG